MLGTRGRLFVASLGLILVSLSASGLWLDHALRGWLEGQVQAELFRYARSGAVLLDRSGGLLPSATSDPLADELGRATHTRVTFIAADGAVLGDSDLAPEAVATVENHGTRPEVIEALAVGTGRARRYSTTVRDDLLYVAIAYPEVAPTGVIRVAKPLTEIDAIAARVRAISGVALLLALGLAVSGSALSAEVMTRQLRQLVMSARALSAGTTRRLEVTSGSEIAGVASSFNRLADELDAVVTELARERDRLGAVLEGMTEGVIAVDADRRVTLANTAAVKLLARDLTGTDVSALPAAVKACLYDPAIASDDVELPDGRVALVRASCTSDGCVLVMLDVTEIRRLERVRRDFVANVSHELRTPVSVILAHAETLASGGPDDPARRRSFVDAIVRNAERLARLIADLLDLSKIESGHYPLTLEPCSVRDIAKHSIDTLQPQWSAANHEIVLTVDDLVACADERALEHALTNLIENAIKYTPEGGLIEVAASADDRTVRIEVRDNGPGVPPEHRDRLFERFYRLDPSRSRKAGGTGLGLSIVRHLVAAMGGRVGLACPERGGSVFTIELPRPTG